MSSTRLFFGLVAMTFCIQATAQEPPNTTIEKIDVFEAKKDGYSLYRIPGIVVTPKGTILAYCEARKNTSSDWDHIDIALRRSTDGGKTWSPMRIVSKVDGPIEKNPLALKVKGVRKEDITFNNAAAIVDAKNGVIHFLFCAEYNRCFHMTSSDDGETFTRPIDITATFDAFRPDYAWKVLATGPGHGIQLKSGRLLVPVWLSLGTGGNAHHPSVAATIVSDDHGKTWQRGDIAVPNQPDHVDPNETSAVQLVDGRVMLITRSLAKANRKVVTFSPDGKTNWTKPTLHDDLLEPICQASVLRLSEAKDGVGQNRLIFSNPNTLDPRGTEKATPGSSRQRKNLTIKLSEDEGKSWRVLTTLEPGPSGYSDLAVLPDGTILCFYERWNLPGRPAGAYSLTLARVRISEK